jgi:hypothetical protein
MAGFFTHHLRFRNSISRTLAAQAGLKRYEMSFLRSRETFHQTWHASIYLVVE